MPQSYCSALLSSRGEPGRFYLSFGFGVTYRFPPPFRCPLAPGAAMEKCTDAQPSAQFLEVPGKKKVRILAQEGEGGEMFPGRASPKGVGQMLTGPVGLLIGGPKYSPIRTQPHQGGTRKVVAHWLEQPG
eukprot:4919942-Pyramimonas_sp.AAC.1